MSASLAAAEALSAIPGWENRDAVITPLSGGLSNRSFRVEHGGEAFVLRLDAEHTKRLGLDRQRELAVLRSAERAGVGPSVEYAAPDAGLLLTRYVEGPTWAATALREPRRVEQLAALLRSVHAMPVSGICFDPQTASRAYLAAISREDPFYRKAEAIAAELHRYGAPVQQTLCHNDVVVANVIGVPPTLIDWEYACDNDPAFDLATLIEFQELDTATVGRLLHAYKGRRDAGFEERVLLERQVYLRLAILWFAARKAAGRDESLRKLLDRLG